MRCGTTWTLGLAIVATAGGTLPVGIAGPDDEPWSVADEAGDVRFVGGVPATGYDARHADLRRVEIAGEDVQGFWVVWVLEHLGVEAGADGALPLYLSFRFALASRAHSVEAKVSGEVPSARGLAFAAGSVTAELQSDETVPLRAELGPGPNLVRAWVPKDRIGSHGEERRPYWAGTLLGPVEAATEQAEFRDELDGTNHWYAFRHPTENAVLTFRPRHAALPWATEDHGTLRLNLSNPSLAPRTVELAYGEAMEGRVRLRGPPMIVLPPNTTRLFLVGVATHAGGSPASEAEVEIQARSRDHDDEQARFLLRNLLRMALAPGQSMLYLHAGDCPPVWCRNGFLAPDAEPRPDEGDRIQFAPSPDGRPASASFPLDGGSVGAPLWFSRDDEFAGEIELRAAGPETGVTVEVRLLVEHGDRWATLATASASTTIRPAGTRIPFSMGLARDAAPFHPRGAGLRLDVEVQGPPSSPAWTVELVPRSTYVRLPLRPPLPEPGYPDGPFQLLPLDGTHVFAYPGRMRALHVLLLNQEDRPHRASLALAGPGDAWSVRLSPGAFYELGAGESVIVGLLATPSQRVGEGERLDVTLTALSEDRRSTNVTLSYAPVKALAIPDDAKTYQDDPEAVARAFEPEDAPVPGPGAASAAALLLASAAWAGARKRRATPS